MRKTAGSTGSWKTRTGKAARLLAAGALAVSLAAGAGAPGAERALADDTPGQVTIEKNARNGKVTYDAHLLFTGHVAAGNRISGIAWKDRATHDAVVGAIRGNDPSYADPAAAWDSATDAQRAESAQLAAEFIAKHIRDAAGNAPSGDATLVVGAGSFADDLARAVERIGGPVAATLEPGRAASLADGYYLFATTPSALGHDDSTGTSPIFAVVGDQDSPVTITEKASVPTIAKHVREDSTGTFGYAADMHAGQRLAWRLTGTVADDIAGYEKYSYRFVDTIDKGLSCDLESVRVYLHHASEAQAGSATEAEVSAHTATRGSGTDVTEHFETRTLEPRAGAGQSVRGGDGRAGAHVLTVGAFNIKKAGIGAKKGDWFTVEYTCTVNDDAHLGNPGNDNAAKLVFSNNPLHSGSGDCPDVPDNPDEPDSPRFPGDDQPELPTTGETVEHRTRTYVYTLNLHKQDKQDAARALRGAKFTIRVAGGDDAGDATGDIGKYVTKDGSLSALPSGYTAITADNAADAALEDYVFTTDEKGDFAVKNIDKGTYTLSEVAAPSYVENDPEAGPADTSAYERLEDATIVIDANVGHALGASGGAAAHADTAASEITDGTALAMTATATAPEPVFGSASEIAVADSVAADGTRAATGVHADTGTVNLVVREAKETQMPFTGGAGTGGLAAVGALVAACGAALMAKRRRGARPADEA